MPTPRAGRPEAGDSIWSWREPGEDRAEPVSRIRIRGALETAFAVAPRGLRSFVKSMPATGTEAWGTSDTWSKVRRQLLRIKLFRFAVAERARRKSPRYEEVEGPWLGNETVRFDRREEDLSWEVAGQGMAHDMEEMVATTAAYDTPIVFISYPVSFGVNRYIADTAERLGVPWVDSRLDLDRALADGYEMDDLVVDSMGPHPGAPLYRYVVETLVQRIDPLVPSAVAASAE